MIWIFAIVFPLIASLVCMKVFKWDLRKTAIYAGIVLALSLLFTLMFVAIGKYGKTHYSEVRSYKILKVEYYEDWNERVTCRHTKYCTRTVKRGTGAHRHTVTERYPCGKQHAYDVDYHPEHWVAVDDQGVDHSISQGDYISWKSLWGNEAFVDLHRNYHTNDGDKYEANWTRKFETIFPWSTIASYENRVRASENSVFKTRNVDQATREKYPRPADKGNVEVLMGPFQPFNGADRLMFRRLDADYGPVYRVHNIVMIFDGNKVGADEIENVKSAWEGPNKNELVTCMGVNPFTNEIVWCDVFSWMDDTTIHVKIRQSILEYGKWDAPFTLSLLQEMIPKYWKKKDFREFEYIDIPVPNWCIIMSLIMSIISVVGMAILIEQDIIDLD